MRRYKDIYCNNLIIQNMIAKELLNPRSIVICGASSDVHKPGGKSLKNLLESPFKGQVYAVNPKETEVQGVKCYAKVEDLPQVDCAILCIAAKFCAQTVDVLAKEKGCKGFIIVSAGFSEESHEGAEIEHQQCWRFAHRSQLYGLPQRELRRLLRHPHPPAGSEGC